MNSNNGQEKQLRYSMLIEWSDEDKAYIVTIPELPGCRTHGKTYAEAVQQGYYAMEGWVESAVAWGKRVPEPKKFVFRWWDENGELYDASDEVATEPLEVAQQRG